MNKEESALPPVAPCAVVQGFEGAPWLACDSPCRIVEARTVAEVLPALREVEDRVVREGRHAVGFVAYEAAPAFDAALRVRSDARFPLLWFGLFDAPRVWARLPAGGTVGGVPRGWAPTIGDAAYARAIAAVKDAIREGETYQVNYTYRMYAALPDDPWTAFVQLAEAQRARHCAYLATGDWTLCSASPELFFRREGCRVASRPMKGTICRGATLEEDEERRAALLTSEKDRAEHLMIVDMVRNDLGRIARAGGVDVPALLTAEKYPTVWQLTSTVAADTTAGLVDLFRALFPAASITGAPKARTMALIAELETTPRRVYTGTIGVLWPDGRAQFNVAIRTLLCDHAAGRAEYGVGGGIVWDSDAATERRECWLKARVLTVRHPNFDLLETLLWHPEGGFALLDRHLRRLARAAAYFGYAWEPVAVATALREAVGVPAGRAARVLRVRLLVSRHGAVSAAATPLDPAAVSFADPVLDTEPVDSDDPFVRHKTTHRDVYARALARHSGAGDVLLVNARGEVTESTIASLVYRMEGQLWTPPVRCGLLDGTYRDWLVDSGRVRERPLRIAELDDVAAFLLANSVRGMHPVRPRRATG